MMFEGQSRNLGFLLFIRLVVFTTKTEGFVNFSIGFNQRFKVIVYILPITPHSTTAWHRGECEKTRWYTSVLLKNGPTRGIPRNPP